MEKEIIRCKWCIEKDCELRNGIADDSSCDGSLEEMYECSYVNYLGE